MSSDIEQKRTETYSQFMKRRNKAKYLQRVREGLVKGPDTEKKKAARARHKQRELDYMVQVRQRLAEIDAASLADWEARFGKDK